MTPTPPPSIFQPLRPQVDNIGNSPPHALFVSTALFFPSRVLTLRCGEDVVVVVGVCLGDDAQFFPKILVQGELFQESGHLQYTSKKKTNAAKISVYLVYKPL